MNEFPRKIDAKNEVVYNNIINKVLKGEDLISDLDLDKISLKDFRLSLEQGIKIALKEGNDFLEQYFHLASYDFLKDIISDEKLLVQFIKKKIEKGERLPLYNYIVSFEVLEQLKKDQIFIKDNLKKNLNQNFKNNFSLISLQTLNDLKEEINKEDFLEKEINRIICQKEEIPKALLLFADFEKFQKIFFNNVLNQLKKGELFIGKNQTSQGLDLSEHYFDLLSEEKINSFLNIENNNIHSIIKNFYIKKGKFFPRQLFYIISQDYINKNKRLIKNWFDLAILNFYEIKNDFLKFISDKDLQKLLEKDIYFFIKNKNFDFPFQYINLLSLENLKNLKIKKTKDIHLAIDYFINSKLDIPENYLIFLSKKDFYKIKNQNFNFFKNKIKEHLFGTFSLPLIYQMSIFKDVLENVLEDIDFIKKVMKKYVIVDTIEFPQNFLNLIKPEVLDILKQDIKQDKESQEIIKDNLKKSLQFGFYIPQEYINLASQETLLQIKEEKELLKKGLKMAMIRKVNKGINNYFSLLSEKEFKDALKDSFEHCILNGLDISMVFLPYISSEILIDIKNNEDLQNKIKETIKKELLLPQSISLIYFYLASDKTINEIKEEKQSQLIIEEMIKKSVFYNLPLSDYYFYFISEKTIQNLENDNFFQKFLLERIKRNILEKRNFDLNYFKFLSIESKIFLTKNSLYQDLFKEVINQRIIQGYSFSYFCELLSNNNFKQIFEKENIKFLIKNSILQAFSFFDFKKEKEVEKIVDDILNNLSDVYLKNAISDRTFLPIGLKIHFKEKKPILNNYLKSTGGFFAHQYKDTFVIPPFANLSSLELFLLTFKKLCELKQISLDNMYYQVCFPERLNNEMCGILTLSFLLSKKFYLIYDEKIIQHNQNAIGLTIYDAGNLINKEHIFFDKNKKPNLLNINGRTDLLFCSDMEDIRIAATIYILIFSFLKEDSFYHELGKSFIKNFNDILKKHNKEHWLNNKFIDFSLFNQEEIQKMGDILIEITQIRQNYNKKINNYKREYEINPNSQKLKQIYKEIQTDIVKDIKKLIEKYYIFLLINNLKEVDL